MKDRKKIIGMISELENALKRVDQLLSIVKTTLVAYSYIINPAIKLYIKAVYFFLACPFVWY